MDYREAESVILKWQAEQVPAATIVLLDQRCCQIHALRVACPGRVVSQHLSGTQTRRIGALVDQYPEPRAEIHPRLAEKHNIKDGDWLTVTTRRTLPCWLATISPALIQPCFLLLVSATPRFQPLR